MSGSMQGWHANHENDVIVIVLIRTSCWRYERCSDWTLIAGEKRCWGFWPNWMILPNTFPTLDIFPWLSCRQSSSRQSIWSHWAVLRRGPCLWSLLQKSFAMNLCWRMCCEQLRWPLQRMSPFWWPSCPKKISGVYSPLAPTTWALALRHTMFSLMKLDVSSPTTSQHGMCSHWRVHRQKLQGDGSSHRSSQ